MGERSIQKTVFNGVFSIHDQKIGFANGLRLKYNDGEIKREMTMEEFGAAIARHMVFARKIGQGVPKVKITVRIDKNGLELSGCNEKDFLEYREETGQI